MSSTVESWTPLASLAMVDQEDGLVARFGRDDDGTGELAVDVRFRDFSGSSAA
jgi:hypothetical protein